jgi:hypothetical protein
VDLKLVVFDVNSTSFVFDAIVGGRETISILAINTAPIKANPAILTKRFITFPSVTDIQISICTTNDGSGFLLGGFYHFLRDDKTQYKPHMTIKIPSLFPITAKPLENKTIPPRAITTIPTQKKP